MLVMSEEIQSFFEGLFQECERLIKEPRLFQSQDQCINFIATASKVLEDVVHLIQRRKDAPPLEPEETAPPQDLFEWPKYLYTGTATFDGLRNQLPPSSRAFDVQILPPGGADLLSQWQNLDDTIRIAIDQVRCSIQFVE